jgi:acetyl-CoA carboxylase/biotin carboxylase 1
MAAFESFAQFEQYFDEILDIMEDLSTPVTMHQKIIDALESGSESRLSSSLNVSLNLGDVRPADQENLQVYCFEIYLNHY